MILKYVRTRAFLLFLKAFKSFKNSLNFFTILKCVWKIRAFLLSLKAFKRALRILKISPFQRKMLGILLKKLNAIQSLDWKRRHFQFTCVKSAPMKACSIPIQTVIRISNCWLGFLHWLSVAESNAMPDNSFADSDPFRFSPYLRIEITFCKSSVPVQKHCVHTLTMDPKTKQ